MVVVSIQKFDLFTASVLPHVGHEEDVLIPPLQKKGRPGKGGGREGRFPKGREIRGATCYKMRCEAAFRD